MPSTRYTSLGSTYNTYPNPYLADPEMEKGFAPAWMLEDGSQERAGRDVPIGEQAGAEIGDDRATGEDGTGEEEQISSEPVDQRPPSEIEAGGQDP